MARLIFISPYMKGGRDAARLAHRTRYFATREGVQLLNDDNVHLPVTKKQQQYIHRLLRSFPEARELPEHEDYANTPNRQTAFALIAQIHEDFIEPMDGRENYLDYVANRPGVKALGEHGLWDAHGKVPSLENAVAEVARHTGNVWTPVISLSRENAERLGYTDLKNWQELINASITDIAKGYKIHPDRLRWYAAMHEKEKHIHVHMVLFSTDPKEGYLSRQGIRSIKSALVSTIYRNDRLHIYEQKDEQRGLLRQEAEARMATLIEQMATGTLQSDKLELLVTDLAQRLREVSGKKVYGYLPPRVKRIVDEIVDELAKDERVSSAYALWQDLREQLCTDYNQTPPQRVPLSQQKEFKTVRNMVIRETLRLSEMNFTFEDDAMQDEPESEEPPVPPDPSAERIIHQQAQSYRRAKKVLHDLESDPGEKAAARVTLRRLWEEGYTIAAHQLGKAYQNGLGISIDRKAAAEWFQKSAEAGNPCSAYALGKLLLEREQFPQALHWLRQAAEQNDPYAQYRLGKLLLTGAEGVPKDVDAAIQLLKDSATQGNSFAQYTLGKLYLLGQEVQADREEALRYFAQAAAQGNSYAQYFIDHQDDFSGAAAGTAILRMLHQMSRIFRENAAQPAIYAGMQIDKKRRRRLQEKRMAMGHKADDHEDRGLTQQTQYRRIRTEKEQTRKALILQAGLISVVILLHEDVDAVIGWRKERFTQRARKCQ